MRDLIQVLVQKKSKNVENEGMPLIKNAKLRETCLLKIDFN